MNRYTGQTLPEKSKIAVIANDAIGNFVVSTPLLQMLRNAHPAAEITYFTGTRVRELVEASDLFDQHVYLYGPSPFDAAKHAAFNSYDLVINLEFSPLARCMAAMLAGDSGFVVGPCLDATGRNDLAFSDDAQGRLAADKKWLAVSVCETHPILKSGFIGEIFCRLAYLSGPVPAYMVPSATPRITIPDVLIATAASLPEKLWPLEKWESVVNDLVREGLTVGLLGAPPKDQAAHWKGGDDEAILLRNTTLQDLRGKLTMPEVTGALAAARLVLTIDTGILHMAACTKTPIVGIFREGIHRLWAPPVDSLTVIRGEPVSDITVETVITACLKAVMTTR